MKTEIKYVTSEDKDFWYSLDKHLDESQFEIKVRDKLGYVLFEEGKPVGLLRYNLFWDNTPFCTMLFVDWNAQKKGYGRKLMEYWESDMKSKGYGMVMVSTQVDEDAQHFYRKLGYKDCGGFTVDIPGYEQPMEMFLSKGFRIMKQNNNKNFPQQTHFLGVLIPEDITLTLEDCRRYMNEAYGSKSGYGTPIHVTLVPQM